MINEKDAGSSPIYIHNYELLNKLGKGAFSTVFKGVHRINKKLVAIKVEKSANTLKHESKILSYLNRELPGSLNIPTLYWYGLYGNNVCISTTFYEMTLLQYVDKICPTKLLGLCEKLLMVIKQLHSAHIVHSDIKPDNFMVDNRENLIIIDFGLSSLFYNVEKYIYRENKICEHIIGTPKYVSYNLHVGNTISRRDDLISIGYLMLTIFKIELPWSSNIINLEDSDLPLYHIKHPANMQRAKYKNFETLKTYLLGDRQTDLLGDRQTDLLGKNNLISYLEKVYALKYEDTPNYLDYRKLFATTQ